jgi:AcrR family transcriptional regulator
VGTRDVILDAAAEVMRTRGLGNATTKEIARAAGFSEATLYKHFADKADLLVAVLRERSTGLARLKQALESTGDDLVASLADVARAAIAFYSEGFPMLASIFSQPDILAAHRDGMRRLDAGPHKANEGLIAYLSAQRDRGHLRPGADPYAAAALLLGACFQHAFLGHMGWADRRDDDEAAASFARALVESLVA